MPDCLGQRLGSASHAWLSIDEFENGLCRCVKCGIEACADEIDPNLGLAEEFDYGDAEADRG